ncbi:MAG: hypothetical protein N4A76_09890 [Firmicutes bacterium]|jgi:hypothetical protein|nr:hypothetical protein [Bacillota bacterium]
MVSIMASGKGTGKTKKIIEMANAKLKSCSGNIIFIDDDKRHMLDINHDIRFMSMDEFPFKKADEFISFLYGMIANNYDTKTIYIDGLMKVAEVDVNEIPSFVDKLEEIGKAYDVEIITTLSLKESNVPSEVSKYLM